MTGKKNYYPTSFPKGTWKITGVVDKHNKDFGPYFINTDAEQIVPIYKKDRDGSWSISNETTVDIGYGIHGGGYSGNPQQENNYEDTTWGCIRLPNGQLILFADLIQTSLNQNKSVNLQVID